MVRHHLPPEYAAPARAYLRAFLDEREATDAMHEVVEDVTYWGDDSLTSVLAATHAVLLSRVRITSEAAASWLVEELGLAVDEALAVTGGEIDLPDEEVPPESAEPPESDEKTPPEPDEEVPPAPVEREHPAPERDEPQAGPERVERASTPPGPARVSPEPLRIGFDEGPLPVSLFDEPPSVSRAWIVAGMLVIGSLLLVAVLLITR